MRVVEAGINGDETLDDIVADWTPHGTQLWMLVHRSKRSIVRNKQGGPVSALLLVKGGLLHGIFRNRIRA